MYEPKKTPHPSGTPYVCTHVPTLQPHELLTLLAQGKSFIAFSPLFHSVYAHLLPRLPFLPPCPWANRTLTLLQYDAHSSVLFKHL